MVYFRGMKRILVGNWKNHPSSVEEARRILDGLRRSKAVYKRLSTIIAPPAPFLALVKEKASSLGALGVQDLSSTEGTATGEIGTDILKSFGVRAVILGHSERRQLGETSRLVAEKTAIAIKSGISPIVCVGESEHDAEGKYFEFLNEEIRSSLALVKKRDAGKIVLAYEPIWAIGKKAKDAMAPAEVGVMTVFIKKTLTELFGRKIAESIPVLYGGSVDSSNAEALAKSGVKGFLVGRASRVPKDFKLIAEALIYA